ncbi:MAG: hypothetical protein ACLUSP_04020 [Christensenellales bacterium]
MPCKLVLPPRLLRAQRSRGSSRSKLVRITDKGAVIADKDGKETEIEADSVISSVGYKPAPAMKKGGRIRLVGDCNGVGNLRTLYGAHGTSR